MCIATTLGHNACATCWQQLITESKMRESGWEGDCYRWERRKHFFFFFCICKVAREMEINQTPIGIRGGGRLRCRWGVPGRSERKSSKSNIKIDLGRAISSKGKPNRENAEQKPREPKAAEWWWRVDGDADRNGHVDAFGGWRWWMITDGETCARSHCTKIKKKKLINFTMHNSSKSVDRSDRI